MEAPPPLKRFPHPRTTAFSPAALLLVTATAAAAQEPAPEAASPIVAEADRLLQEQQGAREQRVDLEQEKPIVGRSPVRQLQTREEAHMVVGNILPDPATRPDADLSAPLVAPLGVGFDDEVV